jgi:hypothetical protein
VTTDHPTFTHHGIVLEPQSLRYNPCNDVIFPSVITAADHVREPLGRFYLYYAPHNAPGGICLAFAESPLGPWTEYDANPIVTRDWPPHYRVGHISSPHVLWVAEESLFFLYFHGENDTTRLATSADGIHFDYQDAVLTTAMYDNISEASYARVFRQSIPGTDTRFLLMFMGNNQGTRRIYLATAHDGRRFTPHREPLINPPPGTGVTQVGAPWYLPHRGRHFVIFHGDKTKADLSNVTSDLYIAEMDPEFRQAAHPGLFYSRTQAGEDNARVSDPCVFEDGGRRYLYMAVGGRLGQRIAVAVEAV